MKFYDFQIFTSPSNKLEVEIRKKIFVIMGFGLTMMVVNSAILKQVIGSTSTITDALDTLGCALLLQAPIELARWNRESKRRAEMVVRVMKEEAAKGWPWYSKITQEQNH